MRVTRKLTLKKEKKTIIPLHHNFINNLGKLNILFTQHTYGVPVAKIKYQNILGGGLVSVKNNITFPG